MFSNLGIVREAISDTELKVLSIGEGKEIIVQASKDYVSSIKAELNDEDGEAIVVEYDLETKVVNENIVD
mgnify:FL=1